MYQQYPSFADIISSEQVYISPPTTKPGKITGLSQVIKPGPSVLGDSQGSVNKKYWLMNFEAGSFYIRSQNQAGDGWEGEALALTTTDDVQSFDFTFNQLGQPVIFYADEKDLLKIWFYDSSSGQYENETISTGTYPNCVIDYPNDTSNSNSDVMIFYVKDDAVYTRLQRERYAKEHRTSLAVEGIYIKSTGITIKNRLQVSYASTVQSLPVQIGKPATPIGGTRPINSTDEIVYEDYSKTKSVFFKTGYTSDDVKSYPDANVTAGKVGLPDASVDPVTGYPIYVRVK